MNRKAAPSRNWLTMVLLALSIGCYVAALALPAIESLGVRGDPAQTTDGFLLLMIGWLGLLAGSGGALSWLANPLLVVTWLLVIFNRRSGSIVTATSAVVCCASVLVLRDIVGDEAGGPKSQATIIGYHSGYWFWLASTGLGLIAALVSLSRRSSAPGGFQD